MCDLTIEKHTCPRCKEVHLTRNTPIYCNKRPVHGRALPDKNFTLLKQCSVFKTKLEKYDSYCTKTECAVEKDRTEKEKDKQLTDKQKMWDQLALDQQQQQNKEEN
jgi:hypothetical protein